MRKVGLLFAVLLVPVWLCAKDTVIYHTSDVHGFFYPKNGQGGYAALASVLKHGPKNYLLLDSGDFSNGTVEVKTSKGIKAVDIMNYMKYDATTIGNHEFDFYEDQVAPILQHANFAVLSANFFYADGKRPDFVKPYEFFTRNGVKFAVIGLANRFPTQATKKYQFNKQLDALEQALTQVEAKKPDVVVVIVHDSIEDDKHGTESYVSEIGKKFGGRVHVVLGGHAHKIFQNVFINGTLFVESGCYLRNVSKVVVKTDDKTGKFVSAKSELIALDVNKVGQDKATAAYANSLREPGVDDVLGTAAETLSKKNPNKNFRDNGLDNWIADLGKAYSGADVFIHNTGGTRVDMEKGPVTKRDLIDIHPFENTITQVEVDGRFLKRLVKSGVEKWSRFAYSGLTASYTRTKKGKIKNLKVLVNGQPVQNRKKYIIATNSFIANGGSEGFLFKQISADKKKQLGTMTIRGLIIEGLKKGPAHPADTGRLVEK